MNRSSFTRNAMISLLGALALGACSTGKEVVDEPTWIDDIRPIVAANCLRCHAYPAIGGAPKDFRLDVYEDTTLKNGQIIRGARTMAYFMAQRAGVDGTMPPDFPRSDGQRGTFENWGVTPTLGERADNAQPKASLLSEPGVVDKEMVTLEYEISDNDGDLVAGRLEVGGVVVGDSLLSGRGMVSFFSGSFEEGNHDIVAVLSDDLEEVSQTIGTLSVAHADGNTAPTLALSPETEVRDGLFAEVEGDVHLEVLVADPDVGNIHTVDITAFRGSIERIIAEDIVVANERAIADWDIAPPDAEPVPKGRWRLRITATDNMGATNTIETGSFVISHEETELTFESPEIQDIMGRCLACHPGAIPGVNHSLLSYEDTVDRDGNPALGFRSLRGKIYRRVVLESTMPPKSARTLFGQEPMSESDRATLKEYLLGGSPPAAP